MPRVSNNFKKKSHLFNFLLFVSIILNLLSAENKILSFNIFMDSCPGWPHPSLPMPLSGGLLQPGALS
jgi:hypothetical protein